MQAKQLTLMSPCVNSGMKTTKSYWFMKGQSVLPEVHCGAPGLCKYYPSLHKGTMALKIQTPVRA